MKKITLTLTLIFFASCSLIGAGRSYSASLPLIVNFEDSTNDRVVAGFTLKNDFTLYTNVVEESELELKQNEQEALEGSINIFWQHDTTKVVTITLTAKPFKNVAGTNIDWDLSITHPLDAQTELLQDNVGVVNSEIYKSNSLQGFGYKTLKISVPYKNWNTTEDFPVSSITEMILIIESN